MSKSPLAKTKVAFAFGLVRLSGLVVNQALFWFFHGGLSFGSRGPAIAATQDRRSGILSSLRLVYRKHDSGSRWYQRFAKSWTTNTASLLLRVPMLLALAHAGMNPHWANATTLLALFAPVLDQRSLHLGIKLVADITGEPVEPHLGRCAHRDEELRWGPSLALNLRVPRKGRQHTATTFTGWWQSVQRFGSLSWATSRLRPSAGLLTSRCAEVMSVLDG
jgi:hypothetical protein